MMKMIMLLCLILLPGTINAIERGVVAGKKNVNYDATIKEGERAAFDGVLVPPWTYRHYTSTEDKYTIMKAEFAELEVDLDKEVKKTTQSIVTPFLWGFVIGSAAVMSSN